MFNTQGSYCLPDALIILNLAGRRCQHIWSCWRISSAWQNKANPSPLLLCMWYRHTEGDPMEWTQSGPYVALTHQLPAASGQDRVHKWSLRCSKIFFAGPNRGCSTWNSTGQTLLPAPSAAVPNRDQTWRDSRGLTHGPRLRQWQRKVSQLK